MRHPRLVLDLLVATLTVVELGCWLRAPGQSPEPDVAAQPGSGCVLEPAAGAGPFPLVADPGSDWPGCHSFADDWQRHCLARPFPQVAAGHRRTCGLTVTGGAMCWGGEGDTPTGTTYRRYFGQISVGEQHGCGIVVAGVDRDEPWMNSLGLRPWALTGGPVQCWTFGPLGDAYGQATQPPQKFFRQVAAGRYHTCGILPDYQMKCWGIRYRQDACPPFCEQAVVPERLVDGRFWQVSAGDHHTCAIRAPDCEDCGLGQSCHGHLNACGPGGRLECWGDNGYGQIEAPVGVFLQVSAGGAHSCAVDMGGRIECWGNNDYGQLDAPDGKFIQVSAGASHTCAIEHTPQSQGQTGPVTCWGRNQHGQAPTTATRIAGGMAFSQISAGASHNCGIAIRCDEGQAHTAAHCWGSGEEGESTPPAFFPKDSGCADDLPAGEGACCPEDRVRTSLETCHGCPEAFGPEQLCAGHAEPLGWMAGEHGGVDGTDLGFGFAHQNELRFLFGDTFLTGSDSLCGEDFAEEGAFWDDIQGTLPLSSTPPAFPDREMSFTNEDGRPRQIRLYRDRERTVPIRMTRVETPEGGFSDGHYAYGFFHSPKIISGIFAPGLDDLCDSDEACHDGTAAGVRLSCLKGLGVCTGLPSSDSDATCGGGGDNPDDGTEDNSQADPCCTGTVQPMGGQTCVPGAETWQDGACCNGYRNCDKDGCLPLEMAGYCGNEGESQVFYSKHGFVCRRDAETWQQGACCDLHDRRRESCRREFCRPLPGGLCADSTVSLAHTGFEGRDRALSVVRSIDFGVSGAYGYQRSEYVRVHSFKSAKFIVMTAETVADEEACTSGSAERRREACAPAGQSHVDEGKAAVLFWGRPGAYGFGDGPHGADDAPRGLHAYLMRHQLQGPFVQAEFQPSFFAGLDGDGEPTWSFDQREAVGLALRPAIPDSRSPLNRHERLEHIGWHMAVSWAGPIDRWIMIYGEGSSMYIRYAPQPWGPWTSPELMLHASDWRKWHPDFLSPRGAGRCAGGESYGEFCWTPVDEIHCPGEVCAPFGRCNSGIKHGEVCWTAEPHGVSCPEGFCEEVFPGQCALPSDAPPCAPQHLQGALYSPNIIDQWTTANEAGGADIYWNVSTWTPYRVALAKTTIGPVSGWLQTASLSPPP